MLQSLWPFERRASGGGDRGDDKALRRLRDIETPGSPPRSSPARQKPQSRASFSNHNGLNGAATAGPPDSIAVAAGHQQGADTELPIAPMQQHATASRTGNERRCHANGRATTQAEQRFNMHLNPIDTHAAVPAPLGQHALPYSRPSGLAWGGSQPPPMSPGTPPSPSPEQMRSPVRASTPPQAASTMPQVVCHHPSTSPSPSASSPESPAAAASPCSPPDSPPGTLQHSPASGMRAGSFTSGTNGKLLRPGVGIGAGTMREARIEDLRLIQQFGEGGFGKVYYGHWCGSPVAIKIATPHAEHPERQLQEFQREVTNMSTLPPHANVLKLLAACFDPQHLALVTEFCSRGSLYSMLHAPGAVPPAPHQRLAMWLGIAQGMQHLHACRVLHRDLKSANLLLDDVGVVKIGDFGLSRVCSGQAAHQALTGGLGTFQWMAPEVLTSQNYSEKADVYSFGMVMWESCTCRLPYEGMTAMQAGLRVATQGVRPEIPPHVDAEQARLIRDCWAPVPDQRPSFQQVVVRLEAMLASMNRPSSTPTMPIVAAPDGSAPMPATAAKHQQPPPQQQLQHQQMQAAIPHGPWQQLQQGDSPPRGQSSSGRLQAQRQQLPSPQHQHPTLPHVRAQTPPLPQRLQQHASPHAPRQRQQPLALLPQQPQQPRQHPLVSSPHPQQVQRQPQMDMVETLPGTVGHESLQEQLQQEQRQWQQEQAGGQQGEHVLIMVGPPPARTRHHPSTLMV